MMRRVVILIAVLVYLTAFGCAMWRGESGAGPTEGVQPKVAVANIADAGAGAGQAVAQAVNMSELPFRGVVLQVQRIDEPYNYHKAIDDIVGLGADTVEIVVDSKMENGGSSVIFVDVRQTPTIDKLTELIQYAKGKGLRVVLMPIVLLEKPIGNQWRGTIAPPSWEEWFESYREMLRHYTQAATRGNADVFVVGSELVSTEKHKDEWLNNIATVRKTFKGLLTYSANWDHYQKIPFWDHLDLISTNCYYKLGENKDVTVEEIVNRWHAIQKDLLAWVRTQHKPYMFTEVGWCSVANAADEPWDYTKEWVAMDQNLQRKLYEGFFQVWYGKPELGGFMIWQWTPGGGGPLDRGYTPAGKPAEQVLRAWLAKPRWQVNPNQ